MARTFKTLRNQVAGRTQPRTRWMRDREFLTEVAGALYELNMFHVKRVEQEIELRAPGLPTEEEEKFLTAALAYRTALEAWLAQGK